MNDKIMPFEIRYVFYKHGNRLATRAEVVKASGLSESAVRRISRCVSWNNISFKEAEMFCRGAGVDLFCPGQSVKHMRRVASGRIKLTHLNWRQKDELRKCYERLAASIS